MQEMKERRCFARPPKFGIRLIMMMLGVAVQALGLSLLIRLNLGTDPCSCLTQGLINHIPVSFGTAQLFCHLMLFVFVIRFDLGKIGFGTVGNMVFLGYIADFFGWMWDSLLPIGFFESMPVKIGFLIPAMAVFILGAATYMTAGLGMSPYDAVPYIIANHQARLGFRRVRMVWDICFMAGGAVLGGNFGVITVVAAFFLGPVIAWMGKQMQRLVS